MAVMAANPYEPPGTEKSWINARGRVNRSLPQTAVAVAFAVHVVATLTFLVAKEVQRNALDEMGPKFWTAGNVSVIAIVALLGTWIVIAAIMMVNGAVWRYRITYIVLAWMIVTGLFMVWLIAGMMRFLYPG